MYGVDDQRRMSVYYANGKSQDVPPTLTRYYLGDYEEEVYPDGKIRKIHYLSGAVLIQTTGVADSLYYTYSDAQGSLIALVHDGGSVIQRFAYDPWGARRDPNNWTQKDSRTSFIINRGYTGHEHLDAFGIINMNGRVYDPLTAMFMSPDPYIQAPGDWLNYNRYGYCMGNPFRYTDPSGNNFWSFLKGVAKIIIEVIVVPAVIFVTTVVVSGVGTLIAGPAGTSIGAIIGISGGIALGSVIFHWAAKW